MPFATILTMVEVDGNEPGFKNPTKFVSPVDQKPEADRLKAEKSWVFKQGDQKYRRGFHGSESRGGLSLC